MHVVRGRQTNRRRVPPPLLGRHAVGARERAGEPFVRGVARFDGDVEHGPIGGVEPIRGALEEDPATQGGRGLTRDRRDHAIQVEPRKVDASR